MLRWSGSPWQATIHFTRLAGTHRKTQEAGALGLAITVGSALWAVQGSLAGTHEKCKWLGLLGWLSVGSALWAVQGSSSKEAALGMPLYDNL